VKPAA